MFVVGANLAAVQTELKNIPKLKSSEITKLEKWIDKMEKELPPLKNFILPTGKEGAVYSFYARAICRRAERVMVGLSEKYKIDNNIKKYLNRLSDCLFVLGRWLNMNSGIEEIKWTK